MRDKELMPVFSKIMFIIPSEVTVLSVQASSVLGQLPTLSLASIENTNAPKTIKTNT